jgi:hypothetical protein
MLFLQSTDAETDGSYRLKDWLGKAICHILLIEGKEGINIPGDALFQVCINCC